MSRCTVYREPCAEHGFVHGAEAEELRKGIEEIAVNFPDQGVDDICEALWRLLDRVDARDSLARLEAKPRKRGAK